MELTYFGGDCLRLSTKDLTAIINPQLKFKSKNDVVLFTKQGTDESASDSALVINTAGEYEIKGVGITGVAAQLHIDKPDQPQNSIIYRLEYNGVSLLFVGNIAPGLSDAQMELIGEVDVLILPVGGHGLTLDAEAAAQIANQLEPRLIIPIHFDDGKTKYEVPQDKIDKFLHELGVTKPQATDKLKVTSKTLPEEVQVSLLEVVSK